MKIATFWRIRLMLDKQIDIDHSFESFHHDRDVSHKVYERYQWYVLYQAVLYHCSMQ